jgi:lipopolysaccharide/colanic/teichoic acid biosynthesis glycosyltransferase
MQQEWPVITGSYRHCKQVCDVILAASALVMSLPLLLLLALWIKIDSPGTVFYLQPRPGKAGRLFTLIKFRSMTAAAQGTRFTLTQTNDARLTNAGKWMRKLHLDELPQLLNVVMGHMSLVGPRPLPEPLYHEYRQAIPAYDARHAVKPGITGFAQVWQGYTTTLEEEALKWKYDLYYMQRLSLQMDATILWATFFGYSSKMQSARVAMREKVLLDAAQRVNHYGESVSN